MVPKEKNTISSSQKISILPKWLPALETATLFRTAQSFQARDGSFKGNYAFLSMCLQRYGGLRLSVVVKVKPKDVNFLEEEIKVVSSKSLLERVIPIPDTPLMDVLRFFQGENIVPHAPYIQRLPKTLWALFQKIFQKAKIDFFGTHQLRHSYARDLLFNGVSIILLSVLLGHKDIRSTLIYSRLLPVRDTI
jgi:Site-specific recombinase XerD